MEAKPIPLNEEVLNIDTNRGPSVAAPIVDAAVDVLGASPARAKARAAERRAEAQSASPPSVTRGAKSQDVPPRLPGPGVYTSVDWFRAVGPEEVADSLMAFCYDKFGPARPVRSRMHYEGGFEFEAGAVVVTGHASRTCLIEIPAGALSTMDGDERIELMRELVFTFGMTARRLDVARDYVGQGVEIFNKALEACRVKGQLCGAKKWSMWEEGGENADADGRTLYLGKRGKLGSGRMVRIYDKGKEQKVPDIQAGYWERFEAEFSKDTAHVATLAILGEWEELRRWREEKPKERRGVIAGNDVASFMAAHPDWVQRAASIALSAMDFRELVYTEKGSLVRDLDRRPRLAWFQKLVDGIQTFRVRAVRRFPSLARWARWMEVAVIPTVKAMIVRSNTGETIDSMLRRVIAGDVPPAEPGKRSVLWEYLQAVSDPAHWTLPAHWTPPRLAFR